VLVKRHPEILTQEFLKAERGGRILVDTGRNGHGATFAAVYSVRPKPGAPVSAPCTWQELESGAVGPQTFTLQNLVARLAAVGDLWSDLHDDGQPLAGPAARLSGLVTHV
jgi:bifunctional non-homologous end joining protein LigD